MYYRDRIWCVWILSHWIEGVWWMCDMFRPRLVLVLVIRQDVD